MEDSDQKSIGKKSLGRWINAEKKSLEKMEPCQHSYLRRYCAGNCKNLPERLTELFTPLKCNLCNCTMGSTITAKDHYEGKKHISNIKKWLFKHSEFENKYFTSETNKNKFHDTNMFSCNQCNIMMSSNQAQLHYMGKKHHSIINNKLLNSIFFNPKKVHWEKCVTVSENRNDIVDTGLNPLLSNKEEQRSNLVCNDYLAKSNHDKRIRLHLEQTVVIKDNILDDVLKNGKKIPSPKDLSIYRTPSGKYYCYSCNVTINSPIQFLQHSESRKHKHKSSSHSYVKFWK